MKKAKRRAKRKLRKFFAFVVLGCIGVGVGKLLQVESVRDKLFEALGEDRYIALDSTVRLLGDLLMWPIDFVRALLP